MLCHASAEQKDANPSGPKAAGVQTLPASCFHSKRRAQFCTNLMSGQIRWSGVIENAANGWQQYRCRRQPEPCRDRNAARNKETTSVAALVKARIMAKLALCRDAHALHFFRAQFGKLRFNSTPSGQPASISLPISSGA